MDKIKIPNTESLKRVSDKVFSFVKENSKLTTIGLLLVILWLVGFLVFPVIGWIINILFVIAVTTVVVLMIKRKR